jgi:hypothetical protein
MINWKEFGKQQSWLNVKLLFWHLSGGPGENYEKPQSG